MIFTWLRYGKPDVGGQVVTGDGVGVAVLVVLANTGTQHPSAQQGDDAAHIMHGCGTCKIVEAHALQPAVPATS